MIGLTRRLRSATVGIVSLLTLAGCGRQECEAPVVLAAASLQDALVAIADDYAATGACPPVLAFGSSGALTAQLEQGARADLFLAADAPFIDRLDRQGLLLPGTRTVYAHGSLAIIGPPGSEPPEMASWTASSVRYVAIANPEHAPYGRAAEQAMRAAGVWEAVQDKLVVAENVAQALQLVETGNAEVGVVAASLAVSRPHLPSASIDAEQHAPLVSVGAVPLHAERPDAGRAFLAWLGSPEGQARLRRPGFEKPRGPTVIDALLRSLWVASVACVASVVVGVPLARLLARRRGWLADVASTVVLLPMILPPTVLGYGLLLLVGRTSSFGAVWERVFDGPIVFTPAAAVLAAFVSALPFLVKTAQSGFEQVDPAYEDVARTLGRSELGVFLHVSVPLAWRGIAAGTALTFARAMGEFGATAMVAGSIPGRTQTASLAVYDAVQAGRLADAGLLAVVLAALTAAVLLAVARTGRW